MAVGPGSRIGPYEVTALVGEGGMGKVWRAHHTGLKRDDALKVLPDGFVSDPERLARFRREAQVLASLNHPNIAHVYGLEQSDGVQALVMELVDGPTLADRISQGPIPLDEALPIARQIAEALEAAHEHGIIHRDLKPANIKLREDSRVKVLDFGLAKALDSTSTAIDATQSPTITSPAMRTGVGVLLGTAAYMSPEQARGKAVDKRSDIWAFGCVLFEMLSGQRAFGGEDVTETLAAVVKTEPAWDVVPDGVPPSVQLFLRRCLQKNPKQRLHDIADMRLALEGAFDTPAARATTATPATPGRVRLVLAGAAAAVVTGAIVGATVWFATRPAPSRVSRLVIAPNTDAVLRVQGASRDVAVTPDGTQVLYAGGVGGNALFGRRLDQLDATAIGRFTSPGAPFVSPDGQWIGFFDSPNILKKVAVTGGPAVTIATVDGQPRGATWGPDDTVVFATGNPGSGLQRVSSASGEVAVLTKPNREAGEVDHVWPEFLPDGRAVLFTIAAEPGGVDNAQIAVFDLGTGAQKILVRGGSHAQYVSTGHLVYGVSGTLRAVAFDLARLEVVGNSVPVVPDLMTSVTGAANFDVANDGTLVYVPDGANGRPGVERTLVWVDREGREEPLKTPPRAYGYPRISPDGTRVALAIRDQMQDIWVLHLARATLTRITFNPGFDNSPVWTPDGHRLLFAASSLPDRTGSLVWQSADGTGVVEPLVDPGDQFMSVPQAISPDAARVVVVVRGKAPFGAGPSASDLASMFLAKERRVEPLMQTPYRELNADISPDGRWLAYESNESEQREVYVRPFPNVSGGRWQVSTGGGTQPVFGRNGRELFYLVTSGTVGADATVMSVPIQPGPAWAAGTATKVITGRYFYDGRAESFADERTYDVSPDGQRFLMVKNVDSQIQQATSPNLVVIQHWGEELKRLVPTK